MKKSILLIILLILIPTISSQPLLIAHKGGEYYKDNNFSYITESIEQGADTL